MGQMRRALVVVLLSLAGAALAPGAALAQDGAVSGAVTDTTGLVLPGVTVEARGASGGPALTTATDGAGAFTIAGLDPGVYELDVHPARLPDRRARSGGSGGGRRRHRRRRDGDRARRAGRRPRQPRPAALGHRVAGAHRRHPLRGRHEPGGHDPRLPAPQPDPLVQRRHPPHQRRRDPRPAGQPAQPLARPHPRPRERQAAPPLVGHRVVRRGDRRGAGARHLDHPVHRPAAGRGAARRRVGAVRLGRHRRRHQLPAQGRPVRGQPRAEHRHLPARRRRRLQLRRQRRPAPRRDRVRQPQPRVRQRQPDRPQRAAPRRGRPRRRRQHPRGRPRPGLGQPPHRGRPEALRQLRPPVRQPGAALRLRQLRRQEGHRGLLLPQPQLAPEHLQPRRRRDPAHRRRAPGPRHGLGGLPGGAGHRQRARPRRPRPGLRRPELLLVPGDRARRVHPAVRRLRHRPVGRGRRAAHRRQRLHVGRQRQLRRPRVRLLLPQHRQRLARPRDPARLRPRPLSAGGRQPQLRRLLPRLRPGQSRGGDRVARRELRDRSRRAALVGGRPLRGPGLHPRLQRLPRLPRLHRRGLDPQQRRRLGRPRAAGSRRPVERGRRRPGRALRRLRQHHQRQAVVPLRPRRRRLGARRRQHRVPGPHAGPAERPQRADDHRPRHPRARRQRHRALDLPHGGPAGRQAPRARDVDQRHRRPRRRHRPVHPDRRLLPGRHRRPALAVEHPDPDPGRARAPLHRGRHLGRQPVVLPVLRQRLLHPDPGRRRRLDVDPARHGRRHRAQLHPELHRHRGDRRERLPERGRRARDRARRPPVPLERRPQPAGGAGRPPRPPQLLRPVDRLLLRTAVGRRRGAGPGRRVHRRPRGHRPPRGRREPLGGRPERVRRPRRRAPPRRPSSTSSATITRASTTGGVAEAQGVRAVPPPRPPTPPAPAFLRCGLPGRSASTRGPISPARRRRRSRLAPPNRRLRLRLAPNRPSRSPRRATARLVPCPAHVQAR